MTIRSAKLATILMVGAALAATPVLAQAVTAGNQGPADIATNRDAPLTLPGTLTPMPTPKPKLKPTPLRPTQRRRVVLLMPRLVPLPQLPPSKRNGS